MKRVLYILVGVAAGLTGCSSSKDAAADHNAAAQAPAKKAPAFCFFKDAEMKSWAAKRDQQGNIVLTGKAHVKDPRYKAEMGAPQVSGNGAEIAPTLSVNTGYEAPDDWWDLSTTIPNSAALVKVSISCGAKSVAVLEVPPKS